jgi:pilus assembly protein CpaE
MPLRILVIAKYDPTFDWVQLSLQEQNYELAGHVDSLDQALRKLERTQVDVILADSSVEGVLQTKWIQQLSVQLPETLMLVIATNTEMDFVREAMLAGAQGFLLKPFSLSELSQSIGQVHQLWLQRQSILVETQREATTASTTRARSMAVFSPKGGTGVTTLAVNLAVAIKQQTDSPVLLVDADLCTGDVDIFLNIFSKYSVLDLIHMDQKVDRELLDRVVTEHAGGITVLRGDPRLQFIDEPIEAGQMSELLEELISVWDGYLIVNTNNSLDRWTLEILDAVDTVLLVATPELPSLRIVRNFLDLAEADADPGEKWQVVMTSYQSQKVLRMTDIEASIRYPIKGTVGAHDVLVSTSINRGTPIMLSHAKSAFAKDVLKLAKQLTETQPWPQKESADSEQSPSQKEMTSPEDQSDKGFSFRQLFSSSLRLSKSPS